MTAQREWFDTDYYQVLGVSSDASQKEITKAYRKLARDSHPDRHPDDPAAEERFKSVSAAYAVLGDEDKRSEYDEVRRLGPMGGMPGAGGQGGFRFSPDDFGGMGDISDLLGQMFGGGRRSGGVRPQRGEDISASLQMDFVDAVRGLTTTLHLTTDATCSTCHGNGCRPGTHPESCPQCGGRGALDDNQGMFSFSTPCPHCRGAGHVINDPCPTCSGSGIERRPREVKVRIPAGVADGQTIRLKGKGSPGRNGGPAGDLLVTLSVQPHDQFRRNGNNLEVTVPVAFTDAALGADVQVPTLDGPAVTIHLKPGTQSGSRHRVKGRGVSTKKATGDLIVRVDVEVPKVLSDQQREALEAFAAASPSGAQR